MEIRHSIILHIIERVNEHILLGIPQQQIENVTIPASKETYSIHVTVHTCKLQALIPVYTNIGIRRKLFLRTPAWILANISEHEQARRAIFPLSHLILMNCLLENVTNICLFGLIEWLTE